MNNQLFQQARSAYAQKDYQGALEAYQQCLQDAANPVAPGEAGQLHHQIGNCLVKLKVPNEAIQSYTQLSPTRLTMRVARCTTTWAWLMRRCTTTKTPCRTLRPPCPTPSTIRRTRLTRGMGNALLKMGKSAEAGVAFRKRGA